MADELTSGEIRRWLERLEKQQRDNTREMVSAAQYQVAHQALIDRVAEAEKDLASGFVRIEADMKAGFERVERTSQERKVQLEKADAETAAAIKAVKEDVATRARGRTSSTANWIAVAGVLVAIGLLIATLVTSGGR